MRLERIEISGFKSFSDRAELAFDRRVTAIVGPNGCGKSNVADAITWVMGEQSAKSLRGERMEDVIFSGSDARKPTAAAEVRLRFSGVLKTVNGPAFEETPVVSGNGGNGNGNGNGHSLSNGNGHEGDHIVEAAGGHEPAHGDFHAADELIQSVAREVEVTRRLYRSGESEYLIDGQVCRLRDVHDLLMDTGLGAKAYAIIEQGKIGLILSSRPADRRQLIEEAAGITKYKARRRSAELKLDAAQQNLTRLDDIVFELEKQRGALKRQAAKARRYRKLRDELRRWEKVVFARRYQELARAIASARGRLAEARESEASAAARVAELEADLGRVRIELVESETVAFRAREAAHASEMNISRRQQQVEFDEEQIRTLGGRASAIAEESAALEGRREPVRLALEDRRAALEAAHTDRDRAGAELAADQAAYEGAHRIIEGLEADVEAARSEVFSALNSATALRHALEHGAAARERVAETLAKLAVEGEDVRIQADRINDEHAAAADGLRRAHEAIEATRAARAARESELASARIEHEWRSQSIRSHERELAALEARLRSLEELEAGRAQYGDAARAVLAQANGKIGQRGAIADYLEVDAGYERAVEACLGDLLQHVLVDRLDQAAAGIELVRKERAGRCGFLVVGDDVFDPGADRKQSPVEPRDGLVSMRAVVRVNGPYAATIERSLGEAWIAASYDQAMAVSADAAMAVATTAGDLFRGPRLVSGGNATETGGILATRRHVKELRDQIESQRHDLIALQHETTAIEGTISQALSATTALGIEVHTQEKAVVGFEAALARSADDRRRIDEKREQLSRERRHAEEEREALDRRQAEARQSITRLEAEQRAGDERLAQAQRRLIEAREAAEDVSRRVADAGALHAALIERAVALAGEVARLDESWKELDARIVALGAELQLNARRSDELQHSLGGARAELAAAIDELDRQTRAVHAADDAIVALRSRTEELESVLKDGRASLDRARAVVAELDVARATAESDLSHLAQASIDSVQATLDEVAAEVLELEGSGALTVEARAGIDDADEPDADTPGEGTEPQAERGELTAETAVARLRSKIDRLGPVNMMAIEQYDELETRHTFLSTQRKDLVDSIAQTSEAIRRIDETTRRRFADAFTAINRTFQETFATLFGGGRAGLTLIDENDPLESGIEIIAQPPGKRLQSVQLLSGGEKALTAIALMFGLFKYKPSPFCLLDEIDAPLDDANIGRFVEMLRSLQQETQFILITHNRKTMEIADRLYGVTMEEPGVSKLVSVQLN
jgi:chromosome segregation protein